MNKHQEYEKDWWGNCANTYGEQEKQLVYARHMGLTRYHDGRSPYNYDMSGKSVIDIGGGPCSLLLKCTNLGSAYVIDPCQYPSWVDLRYTQAHIACYRKPAEVPLELTVDEVWCYNVLQHTDDPEVICKNMQQYGKIIRLFEWIDTKQTLGHPHILEEVKLNKWLGGQGQVGVLNLPTLKGKYYSGIFIGGKK